MKSYKNLSTSRGEGNACSPQITRRIKSGIRTYPPREGTETTTCVIASLLNKKSCIRTYLPREGTETFITPPPRLQYPHNVEQPIHLERGRRPRSKFWNHPKSSYRHLSTFRGAVNAIFLITTSSIIRIDTYLPREGPETKYIQYHY